MKAKRDELERLAEGLGDAADPYRIKSLLGRSLEDLAEHVEQRIRYTAIDMVDQGRYFKAIKEKCGHGGWEAFVEKRGWSWEYVRCCMKLIEVVVEFPQAIHLPPGTVTKRLLHLPPLRVQELFEDLSPEAVRKLTPWDLEKAHHNKKSEDARARKNKRERSAGELAKEEKLVRSHGEEALFDEAYDAAILALRNVITASESADGALKRLIDVVDPERDKKKIFNPDHPLLPDLGGFFERLKDLLKEIERRLERLAARARGAMLP